MLLIPNFAMKRIDFKVQEVKKAIGIESTLGWFQTN
jgi:hypothetical protein